MAVGQNTTPYWNPVPVLGKTTSTSTGVTQGSSTQQSSGSTLGANQTQASNFSQSYIPEYSQTPILESIAKQAQSMAPEAYQWGMDQYNKNQGNIDTMMKNAMNYSSPSRISSEMGKAEAGVQQGAEAGRQSAVKDLQSFGVDPSSGRYAALDQASRVMSGAAAAGAGNQQRTATELAGTQMQKDAAGLSLTNEQTGYGAANAANQLLGTASQLKYSPLGTMSGGTSESSGFTSGTQQSSGSSLNQGLNTSQSQQTQYNPKGFAGGGDVEDDDATTGGFVSQDLSPSAGAATDDVNARLNTGEFVIPKDVAAWKGQEFFYKLMAQSRMMRAKAGSTNGGAGGNGGTGYAAGGDVSGSSRWLKPPEGANPADYLPGTGVPRGSFSKGFEQQMDLDAIAQRDKDFQKASDAKYGAKPQEYWDELNQAYPSPLPWSAREGTERTGYAPGPQFQIDEPEFAPQRSQSPYDREYNRNDGYRGWNDGYRGTLNKPNRPQLIKLPNGQTVDMANSPDFIMD